MQALYTVGKCYVTFGSLTIDKYITDMDLLKPVYHFDFAIVLDSFLPKSNKSKGDKKEKLSFY